MEGYHSQIFQQKRFPMNCIVDISPSNFHHRVLFPIQYNKMVKQGLNVGKFAFSFLVDFAKTFDTSLSLHSSNQAKTLWGTRNSK